MHSDFIFNCNIDSVARSSKPTQDEIKVINNRVIKEENFIQVSFDDFVKKVTLEGKSYKFNGTISDVRVKADVELGDTSEHANVG
jgi:hypothetical protein